MPRDRSSEVLYLNWISARGPLRVILDRIGLSASCPVYPRSRPLGRTSRFGSFVRKAAIRCGR
jgi:hypothetical protein